MALEKRYHPQEIETRLMEKWQAEGVYHYVPGDARPVFSIDTPPPTVSGNLHLGHTYSYSHTDFIARFWRMRGWNVFYPMGYDDNGLPTERLVEKRLGITAQQVGRQAFIEKCLQVSEEAEQDYEFLWKRLGLSIDWRFSYRTIDEHSRRTSQLSFLDLYRKGLAYRREAPAIWCPECRTSIAQAELHDLDRQTEFVTLAFSRPGGEPLLVATTRPELLPACVAVFVHPQDARYKGLAGEKVRVPLFNQEVPVLEDPGADPEKGTGAVMCCTFGDTADVAWWYTHHLPLIEALSRDGRMTAAAGDYAGQTAAQARQGMKEALEKAGMLLERQSTSQSIRVHERCDTPVEYIITHQWFVKVLDHKEELLATGSQVAWHPEHMQNRFAAWVENLNWDWCISRQRYFGVPFPVWYCRECGEVMIADEEAFPVDPLIQQPPEPCPCGSREWIPEEDVMDTWATSSLSPQIVGRWLNEPALYAQVFPFSLRPQAHEIIRTWAFYTIVKSHFHFHALPWHNVMISGWGLAGEGMGKISKSRGGGPMAPLEMIGSYSADAVRYWAASTGTGKDSIISEEKIQLGAKLVTKLWNVARFSERFLEGYQPAPPQALTPADQWLLAGQQRLVRRVTELFESYDYAAAKSEIEAFFWRDLADNYLEMAKQRLYGEPGPVRAAAQFTLYTTLLALLKMLAPLMPFITETVYTGLYAETQASASIHTSAWPEADPALEDSHALQVGERLVAIATAVRRYKSERNLPLGSEIPQLQLAAGSPALADVLKTAVPDLVSVCRVQRIEITTQLDPLLERLALEGEIQGAIG